MTTPNTPSEPSGGGEKHIPRVTVSEADKQQARKWFAHARKSLDTRNFDYAIEQYVSGLRLWPTAVEEGLKPLRLAGHARKQSGGKPAGFLEARKHPTNGRDPRAAMNNALHLFGLDPVNVGHMESILALSAKSGCDSTTAWIAPILADAFNHTPKRLPEARYAAACDSLDQAAEVAMAADNSADATAILNAGIATAQIWERHYPASGDAQKARSRATSKLAIVKGRFDRAEDFTVSIHDRKGQQDIHDQQRMVVSEDRSRALVERAKAEWQANPDQPNKLLKLIDLMIKEKNPQREAEAIELLQAEFQSGGLYTFKAKADNVRLRQKLRELDHLREQAQGAPDDAEIQARLKDQLESLAQFKLAVWRERHAQYPTDLSVIYQLGVQLFLMGRYDEAIPLLQQAQHDNRHTADARLYIGQCFYLKGFFEQAVSILQRACDEYELNSNDKALDLRYWLARSHEAAGQTQEARKLYGYLIQIDYNYRDARQRLEKIVAGG